MTTSSGFAIAALVSRRLEADDPDRGDVDALLMRRIDSLNLDSLDTLEMIMEIEDANEILLDEQKVVACQTVSDIANLVDATKVGA